MKLILSSCDFRNENSCKCITENLGMPIQQCRVLCFPNEKSTRETIESDKYYNRLSEFGFERKNINVFNYYAPDFFDDIQIDAIYISGGNTFGTLDRIRKAGFCDKIVNYVKTGAIYIGGSAGAHIASADIEHVMEYDSNTTNMSVFNGLNLFDGILICHFTDERKDYEGKLQHDGRFTIYTLTDNQSLLIDDNEVKKI